MPAWLHGQYGPISDRTALLDGFGESVISSIIGTPVCVLLHITITKTNIQTLSRDDERVFVLMLLEWDSFLVQLPYD